MDFWVMVLVGVLVVVVVVLVGAEASRLFLSWDRFARRLAASRPDALVVLAQMRPDVPRQLRMLAGDAGIRDQTRDDTGVALVIDATRLELYRDPAQPPVFARPTRQLVAAALAEHTALSERTGKALRKYPSLRLSFNGSDAVGDLDLVPLAGSRLAFLAAKPPQIEALAEQVRAMTGLPGDAAS